MGEAVLLVGGGGGLGMLFSRKLKSESKLVDVSTEPMLSMCNLCGKYDDSLVEASEHLWIRYD